MTPEQMIPEEILEEMPSNWEAMQKDRKDAKVYLKIFNPHGKGLWYLTGYDPERRMFYGLVSFTYVEQGEVAMDDLVEGAPWMKLIEGTTLERDLWLPDDFTLEDAMKEVRKRKEFDEYGEEDNAD